MKLGFNPSMSYSKLNCKDCNRRKNTQNMTQTNAQDSVSFASKKINKTTKKWLISALAALSAIGIAIPTVKQPQTQDSTTQHVIEKSLDEKDNVSIDDDNNDNNEDFDNLEQYFDITDKKGQRNIFEDMILPETPVVKNIFEDIQQPLSEEEIYNKQPSETFNLQPETPEYIFKTPITSEPTAPNTTLPQFPAVDYPEDIAGYETIINDYFDEIFAEVDHLIPGDDAHNTQIHNQKIDIVDKKITELTKKLEEAEDKKAQADAEFEKDKKRFQEGKITKDELMASHVKTQEARREVNRLDAILDALHEYVTVNHKLPMPLIPTEPPVQLPVFPYVDYPEDLVGYDQIIDNYFAEIFEGLSYDDLNPDDIEGKYELRNKRIAKVDEKRTEVEKQLEEAKAAKADADAKFEKDKELFLKSEITESELFKSYVKTQETRREVGKLNAISKALLEYVTVHHPLPMPPEQPAGNYEIIDRIEDAPIKEEISEDVTPIKPQ